MKKRNLVKELRTKKGITQLDLGYLCSMSQQQIERVEKGSEPTIFNALKLAKALEVRVDELFFFDKSEA